MGAQALVLSGTARSFGGPGLGLRCAQIRRGRGCFGVLASLWALRLSRRPPRRSGNLMRMKFARVGLAAVLVLAAPRAFARCEGDASCTKLDTLLANPGASPFAALGSSDVLSPLDAGFGFQVSHIRNAIAVIVPTASPDGQRVSLVDSQLTGSWLFAFGLGAGLEVGVALDSVLSASGPGLAGANAGQALRQTGIGDVRSQVRWAALERPRVPSQGLVGEGFGLAFTAAITAPTGMSGAFASEHGVMGQPTVTGDYVSGPFRAAIDLGARVRRRHSVFDAKWGSQLLIAAAAAYDILPIRRMLAVGVETWALPSLVDARQTVDFLGTLSSAPAWAGELALVAGVGRSFVVSGPDLGAPDFRMTFAVRYAPRDVDSDGDGLIDKNDPCPAEIGPIRDTNTPGCPDHAVEDLTKAPGVPVASPGDNEPPGGRPTPLPSPEAPSQAPSATPAETPIPGPAPAAPLLPEKSAP